MCASKRASWDYAYCRWERSSLGKVGTARRWKVTVQMASIADYRKNGQTVERDTIRNIV
jgi:hypothetical protein